MAAFLQQGTYLLMGHTQFPGFGQQAIDIAIIA
jgi:hypothetical protein